MSRFGAAIVALALVCSTVRAADKSKVNTDFPEEGIRRILVTTITETSATVIWTTSAEERGEVAAWKLDNKLVRVKDEKPTRNHSVTLKGLTPGVIYHFLVDCPSGRSHLHHFRTMSSLPGEPVLRFAVVAGAQVGGPGLEEAKALARAVADINSRGVDLVAFPGDIVADGSEESFKLFKKIADGLKAPYCVAPGRREGLKRPGLEASFKKVFNLPSLSYARDVKGRRFVFIGRRGAPWSPARPGQEAFVFSYDALADDPFVFEETAAARPPAGQTKARAAYSGRWNTTSATISKGVLYVSCPKLSACGYLVVSVYPDGVIQTFFQTPGLRLAPPASARIEKGKPLSADALASDPGYRWGRQEARNFTWRFGRPGTSTGIK